MPEAFIKLTGNARAGKSTLCQKLTQFMRHDDYRVVYFDYAIESPDMLRTTLAKELELPNSSNFARLLEDSLRGDKQKPVVLIFDDAHLLSDITLIEIYRLAEIQVGAHGSLNILLCGEVALDKRLSGNDEFKSLLLSISDRFVLQAMDAQTLPQFFMAYLEKAELPGLQLDTAATNYFYKCCKGYPGPATALCQLIVQARLGSLELTPIGKGELVRLVKSAASEHGLPSSNYRDSNRLALLGPLGLVVIIAVLGFLFQWING
jgi:type II secretory pathway predicted ATPase ExeA